MDFSSNATQHIYQRCKDHGVVFYTTEDRIVYYTLAACKAKKYGISVYATSLMFTHLHQSISAGSLAALRSYLQDTNSAFSRLYNHHYKRSGKLFEKEPGRSQKLSSKDKRSNIIYVFNNHVEKGLCSRAVDERWSFLAYAFSNNPFSEPICLKSASRQLIRYLRLVDRRVSRLKAIEYCDLEKIFKVLSETEQEQFIDYVISRYALIDFSQAIRHFGSLETMMIAIESTTGGEYEIKEDYTKLKDTGYIELLDIARTEGFLDDVYSMNSEEKAGKIVAILSRCNISVDHLRRFFHKDFSLSSIR